MASAGGLRTDGERFDLGRVAARTFGVIGRHPALFLGVALLFSGLPAFGLALREDARLSAGGVGPIVSLLVGGFVYFVFASLMQTSLVVATLQDLSGRRVDFAACVSRALRLFLPLVGLSIVMGVALMFGFLLLIVPGVILYLMWFVAAPVLVEERRGVFAALARSRVLTAGARWPIFGLVVAFLILTALATAAQALLERLVPAGIASAAIGAAASMLTSLIASTGVAATYVELRTVKEGADVDALAAVFA